MPHQVWGLGGSHGPGVAALAQVVLVLSHPFVFGSDMGSLVRQAFGSTVACIVVPGQAWGMSSWRPSGRLHLGLVLLLVLVTPACLSHERSGLSCKTSV